LDELVFGLSSRGSPVFSAHEISPFFEAPFFLIKLLSLLDSISEQIDLETIRSVFTLAYRGLV